MALGRVEVILQVFSFVKLVLQIDILSTSYQIGRIWVPQNPLIMNLVTEISIPLRRH